MRPDKCVQAIAEAMRSQFSADLDVRCHGQCVDARIGAPSGRERRFLAGHPQKGFLERLLDRGPMLLPLPAHERGTVIFDGHAPSSHGRIVPIAMGKPRSSSSGVISPRPARCTFSGRM